MTKTLFGFNSEWKRATRVSFSFPRDDTLEITVWQQATPLFTRTFSGQAGDFTYEAGRLVVHNRFGQITDVGPAFVKVTLTLSATNEHLVANVQESGATILVIVPLVFTETRWERFPRLRLDSGTRQAA